jgi:ubiquinone/menaquinone biosynthesis C-methylase UbiE
VTVDRATVFGEVAETYDRLRPPYPAEMFDDLAAAARLTAGSTVLEIGCGTGIATVDLVARGYDVCAVDPDPRMLRLARRRIPAAGVRFIEGRFEDLSTMDTAFDLILAAGSWHWVDRETALPLAASMLTSTGSLAVCWNLPRPEDSPRPRGLDEAYREFAPELAEVATQARNKDPDHRRREIARSGWFSGPESFSYRWTRVLSSAKYADLLSTHSDHRMLGPDRASKLLAAIRDVLDGHGGSLELSYETVLYFARPM